MKVAYADPPYLGCARKLYSNADFDSPERWAQLIQQLDYTLSDGRIITIVRRDDYCEGCDREGATAGAEICQRHHQQ